MGADVITGWEQERRSHFDEIVAKYDKVRPEYPCELFNDILKYSGLGKDRKAVEIGAGTGKATIPFLDAGYMITAVEIGENMADFLRVRFNKYKNFNIIISAFEDALLDENNYDLIYAASAFHWVDAKIGCPKVFRLLKSGGVFSLLRYNFNFIPADGDELSEEIQAIYNNHYFSNYKNANKPLKMSRDKFEKFPKILSGYGFEDMNMFGFTDVSMSLYEVKHTYSADEWIAFLDTLSDHRCLPEDDRMALYAGVKQAITQHGGYHKLDIIFQLYMGRKP